MKIKKVILFTVLFLLVGVLFLTVFSVKNRVGLFGKLYDSHLKKQAEKIQTTMNENLDKMFMEVRSLSSDGKTQAAYVSFSLGEDTSRYISEFRDIQSKMTACRKIQLTDQEGKVFFSTQEDEILTQRLKSEWIKKWKDYFSNHKGPYLLVRNQKELLLINPVKEDDVVKGFVLTYHLSQGLFEGLGLSNLNIPYSADRLMLVSSQKMEKQQVGQIVQRYKKVQGKNQDKRSIGTVFKVKNLVIISYNEDKFIPKEVYFILIFVIFSLAVVIYQVILLFKEQKVTENELPSSLRDDTIGMNASTTSFAMPNQNEIRDLVDDIEQDQSFDESSTQEGIEDMIMNDEMDLNGVSDLAPISMDDYGDSAEELEESNAELPKIGGSDVVGLEESEIEVSEVSEEEPESLLTDTPEESTQMFAKQERIINHQDEDYAQTSFKEIESVETPVMRQSLDELEGIPELNTDELSISLDEDELSLEAETLPALEAMPEEEKGKVSDNDAIIIPDDLHDEDLGLGDTDFGSVTSVSEENPGIELEETREDMSLNLEEDTEILPVSLEEESLSLEDEPIEAEEGVVEFNQQEDKPLEEPLEVMGDIQEEPVDFSLESEENVEDVLPDVDEILEEPPVKVSHIGTVEDYISVARDIAQNHLGLSKMGILKKKGTQFDNLEQDGFEKSLSLSEDDPIYAKFLQNKKSLSLKNHLSESRYLREKFSDSDLSDLEEIIFVPIIKNDNLEGVGIFARKKGEPEPNGYQRSELHTLGFLQE